MGILDEAIRQHLELKRRQGADDDELKRLEDEAFGPPTRPGEPDFPEQPPEGSVEENGSEVQAEVGAPEAEGPVVESPPPVEVDQAPSGLEESLDAQPAAPSEGGEEPEQAEIAAEGDETSAPAFDHGGEKGFELGEIDLDLEQELDQVRGIDEGEEPGTDVAEEPPSEPAPPTPGEPPIESLDTVEHQVDEVLEQPAPAEQVIGEPPAEDASDDQPPAEGEGDEEGTEDVLEETPEFLQDAPEDDELWFEQGKPKDFDF